MSDTSQHSGAATAELVHATAPWRPDAATVSPKDLGSHLTGTLLLVLGGPASGSPSWPSARAHSAPAEATGPNRPKRDGCSIAMSRPEATLSTRRIRKSQPIAGRS